MRTRRLMPSGSLSIGGVVIGMMQLKIDQEVPIDSVPTREPCRNCCEQLVLPRETCRACGLARQRTVQIPFEGTSGLEVTFDG